MMPEVEKHPKHNHTCQVHQSSSRPGRCLCKAILIVLILSGLTALILYLIYHPTNPQFSVTAAAIYDVNTTSYNTITTTMQFTIVSYNSNNQAAIFYDHLTAYVSYHNQPITPLAQLPPMFQYKASSVAVSPLIGGKAVPVSAEVVAGIETDEGYGVVGLRLVLLGRMRYKSGPFYSAWYGVVVRCDLLVGFKRGAFGTVPLIGEPQCDVDV